MEDNQFLLANPVLDKLIAFVAVLPFLFYVFRVLQRGTLELVPLGIAFQHLLIVVTMLVGAHRCVLRPTPGIGPLPL